MWDTLLIYSSTEISTSIEALRSASIEAVK